MSVDNPVREVGGSQAGPPKRGVGPIPACGTGLFLGMVGPADSGDPEGFSASSQKMMESRRDVIKRRGWVAESKYV